MIAPYHDTCLGVFLRGPFQKHRLHPNIAYERATPQKAPAFERSSIPEVHESSLHNDFKVHLEMNLNMSSPISKKPVGFVHAPVLCAEAASAAPIGV